eukprot:m.5986 g.5986  ORF g.5986 m.5986 type:complete len:164 (-) comp3458_c0_seq1:79-570(-)
MDKMGKVVIASFFTVLLVQILPGASGKLPPRHTPKKETDLSWAWFSEIIHAWPFAEVDHDGNAMIDEHEVRQYIKSLSADIKAKLVTAMGDVLPKYEKLLKEIVNDAVNTYHQFETKKGNADKLIDYDEFLLFIQSEEFQQFTSRTYQGVIDSLAEKHEHTEL